MTDLGRGIPPRFVTGISVKGIDACILLETGAFNSLRRALRR